jgi:hypothetical protein
MWQLQYVIKELPVLTKRATVSLNKVKSCSTLLHMLLICIRSYEVSKISSEIYFFNFGYLLSGHSIFTSARMWGSVVIFRSQKGSASKKRLSNTDLELPKSCVQNAVIMSVSVFKVASIFGFSIRVFSQFYAPRSSLYRTSPALLIRWFYNQFLNCSSTSLCFLPFGLYQKPRFMPFRVVNSTYCANHI